MDAGRQTGGTASGPARSGRTSPLNCLDDFSRALPLHAWRAPPVMSLLPSLATNLPATTASALAALVYAVLAWGQPRMSAPQRRGFLVLAWTLHLLVLMMGIFEQPTRFGFAPALSVTAWLVLTVYLIESRLYPQMRARWTLAVLGMAVVVLAWVFPGTPYPALQSPLMPLHWALGIASYGLIGAAVVGGTVVSGIVVSAGAAVVALGQPKRNPITTTEVAMSNQLYALSGQFETPDEIMHAAEEVNKKYKQYDVNTPYPVHGMDGAMGMGESPIGWVTLIVGTTCMLLMLCFIAWIQLVDYPTTFAHNWGMRLWIFKVKSSGRICLSTRP